MTSNRTAKVVSNANAPVIAAISAPIVGEKLRYYLSAAVATHRTAWQWQHCDKPAMTGNCVLRAQSNSARDAHTEYTPMAGTDSNVGKYLQAYAYYAANDAGKTWRRTDPHPRPSGCGAGGRPGGIPVAAAQRQCPRRADA